VVDEVKNMQKMILIRGLPGSGKSTLAKYLIGFDFFHYEADQFWMVDGEYKFDMSRIKEAHQWCQDEVRGCLTRGFSPIVSNTFTTAFELLPYFDIAKEFNIKPQVILVQGSFGNIHNVPDDVLAKMAARFEYNIDHLWSRLL
jgi:predicted kinase